MSGVEDRLREALHAAAIEPARLPDVDRIAVGVRHRRRTRWAAGSAAAALLVAGGATAGALAAGSGSASDEQTVIATPPPTPVTATGRQYAVIAPAEYVVTTGDDDNPSAPACTPSTVTARATTVRAADGVLGLIALTPRNCRLDIGPPNLKLVDADGRALDVTVGPANPVNPGAHIDVLYRTTKPVKVGFAWSGGYCSGGPVSVEIQLGSVPRRIALTGPVPGCADERGRLSIGTVNRPDRPAEPAPAAWTALSARVIPTVASGTEVGYEVRISNASDRDISLSAPCPAFSARADMHYRTENATVGVVGYDTGDLCDRSLTVPARGFVTVPRQLALNSPAAKGATITISWQIAGVPEATGTTTVPGSR